VKPKYIILDLDNCIADDGWRIPKIAWGDPDLFRRYHQYHQLAAWDPVGNLDLIWNHSHEILILTSRPVHYRTLTEEWLRRADVKFKHLLMRNDNDFRYSHEVKAAQVRWLQEYNVALEEIDCAYDDRELVLAEYRKFGLRTELRAIHNVSAYPVEDKIAHRA